jgi:hypothetical protein
MMMPPLLVLRPQMLPVVVLPLVCAPQAPPILPRSWPPVWQPTVVEGFVIGAGIVRV